MDRTFGVSLRDRNGKQGVKKRRRACQGHRSDLKGVPGTKLATTNSSFAVCRQGGGKCGQIFKTGKYLAPLTPYGAGWLGNDNVPFENCEYIVAFDGSGPGAVQEHIIEHDAGIFRLYVVLGHFGTGGRSTYQNNSNSECNVCQSPSAEHEQATINSQFVATLTFPEFLQIPTTLHAFQNHKPSR